MLWLSTLHSSFPLFTSRVSDDAIFNFMISHCFQEFFCLRHSRMDTAHPRGAYLLYLLLWLCLLGSVLLLSPQVLLEGQERTAILQIFLTVLTSLMSSISQTWGHTVQWGDVLIHIGLWEMRVGGREQFGATWDGYLLILEKFCFALHCIALRCVVLRCVMDAHSPLCLSQPPGSCLCPYTVRRGLCSDPELLLQHKQNNNLQRWSNDSRSKQKGQEGLSVSKS